MTKIIKNEPLKNHTTYKTGGNAKYFALPKTIEELIDLLKWKDKNSIDLFVMGKGSNILFSDNGFDGLVISLKEYDTDIHIKDNLIEAGSGVELDKLVKFSINHYFKGLENLSGIPGCIGGNIYMNAGAFGTEMKDVVKSIKILDTDYNIISMNNSEIGFKYRKTNNINNKIILSAVFELEPIQNKENLISKRKEILAKRKEKQPLDFPSCGSVFKRPENSYAGLLIEENGLKGFSIGGAMVSEKHANFIINKGDATSKDIFDLIKEIKRRVFEKSGIELEEEVKLVGF
jgi:UDP-N-acetylmuramate dehydrogenase